MNFIIVSSTAESSQQAIHLFEAHVKKSNLGTWSEQAISTSAGQVTVVTWTYPDGRVFTLHFSYELAVVALQTQILAGKVEAVLMVDALPPDIINVLQAFNLPSSQYVTGDPVSFIKGHILARPALSAAPATALADVVPLPIDTLERLLRSEIQQKEAELLLLASPVLQMELEALQLSLQNLLIIKSGQLPLAAAGEKPLAFSTPMKAFVPTVQESAVSAPAGESTKAFVPKHGETSTERALRIQLINYVQRQLFRLEQEAFDHPLSLTTKIVRAWAQCQIQKDTAEAAVAYLQSVPEQERNAIVERALKLWPQNLATLEASLAQLHPAKCLQEDIAKAQDRADKQALLQYILDILQTEGDPAHCQLRTTLKSAECEVLLQQARATLSAELETFKRDHQQTVKAQLDKFLTGKPACKPTQDWDTLINAPVVFVPLPVTERVETLPLAESAIPSQLLRSICNANSHFAKLHKKRDKLNVLSNTPTALLGFQELQKRVEQGGHFEGLDQRFEPLPEVALILSAINELPTLAAKAQHIQLHYQVFIQTAAFQTALQQALENLLKNTCKKLQGQRSEGLIEKKLQAVQTAWLSVTGALAGLYPSAHLVEPPAKLPPRLEVSALLQAMRNPFDPVYAALHQHSKGSVGQTATALALHELHTVLYKPGFASVEPDGQVKLTLKDIFQPPKGEKVAAGSQFFDKHAGAGPGAAPSTVYSGSRNSDHRVGVVKI